ncbi:class I SAM-dependent methyltransferase [Bacteroidota bacterium]
METDFLKEGFRILDFSPSRSIYRAFKKNPSIQYSSSDLSGDFLSDHHYDITNIESQDETYDMIICYHILEHIEDDTQAMKELHRIVKNNGACIIQTPWKEGDIYEDNSVKSEEDRLKHFGQIDHVRIYSVMGLKQRLTDCGFNVDIREYHEEAENRSGYKTKESVLICRK